MRLNATVRRPHLGILLGSLLALGLALQLATPAPALPAPIQPQFVQQNSATTTGTSVSATLPSPVTAGDTIVVTAGGFNSTGTQTTAMTDSAGNTYLQAIEVPVSPRASYSSLGIWYAANVKGGAGLTVTSTFSAIGSLAIAAQEYSGLGPAVTPYQTAGASAVSDFATICSPLSVNQNGELLFAALTIDDHFAINTVNPGTGYNLRAEQLASDVSHQAIITEDEGTGTPLTPGNYGASFTNLTTTATPFAAWHLVVAGFGATVSPTNTPLPTPTGTPIVGCYTEPKSQLNLPMVSNEASLGGLPRVARP